ncbi:MAG: putative lipid II flippase FtsW [Planctomycetota bacterium]|nr:putative lipid II flippase FtsW [Planctomycetota bacterium]
MIKGAADTAGGAYESFGRRPSATVPLLLRLNSPSETLLIVVATLVGISIVMMFSLNPLFGEISFAAKFVRHLLFISVSLSVAFLVYLVGAEKLLTFHKLIFIVCAIALIFVFIPPLGGCIRGAARWLSFGSFHFQPSELAKLVVALLAAKLATEKNRGSISFKQFLLKAVLPVTVLTFLVLIEPDFGSAMFLLFISMVFFFVAGIPLRHILLTLLFLSLLTVPIAVLKLEHVRSRVSEFLSEESDYLGRGYQPRQSLIALGSGGVVGRGLGASRQKLMFLPDRDTDFIFAIIGEEMGFCGAASVLLLFVVYFICSLQISIKVQDAPLQVLAFAASFVPTAQALMNIAVVSASVPTKGISLPFVSFGGSSLLVNFIWVALLVSIAKISDERRTSCEE